MDKSLDGMDEEITQYHIDHGCDEYTARFLAWLNSNFCEMNGFFKGGINKDKFLLGVELSTKIDATIDEFIESKKQNGININYFTIMKGIYNQMLSRYRQYCEEELGEIDPKNYGKAIYHIKADPDWWKLP